MKKAHPRLIKILLFLFSVNSLSLCFYFSSSPLFDLDPINGNHQSPLTSLISSSRRFLKVKYNYAYDDYDKQQSHYHASYNYHMKAWPKLPSQLPWNQSKLNDNNCEAFFGNGFNTQISVLSNKTGNGGWFRCLFSRTLNTSICEGGEMRMVPERIHMSRGGEQIEEVMRRQEDEELPKFENGAFQVQVIGKKGRLVDDEFLNAYVPKGNVSRHSMRDLIKSIEVVDDDEYQCDLFIEEPVLLVTRFEYANLFHTVTDWYSAYVTSRVTELPRRPHLIFVDGHCRAPMEQAWNALFSSLNYAKSFVGPVCFRHTVLVPLGYDTALAKGVDKQLLGCVGTSSRDLLQNPDDHKTARLSEFGEMIREALGFHTNEHHVKEPVSGHNVLFIRREDYLAHPRHVGRVESRLQNEPELFETLTKWASDYSECKINLVNGLFAHMSMTEQVQAIQDASVIIGAHGAGLTHMVSAAPETIILEIISEKFRRPHFGLIARWKGLRYHAIYLDGVYAYPDVVVDRLKKIMLSIGC